MSLFLAIYVKVHNLIKILIFIQDLYKGIEETTPLMEVILSVSQELKPPPYDVQEEVAQLQKRWDHVREAVVHLDEDLQERSATWQEYDNVRRQVTRWLDMQESIVGRECGDYTGSSGKLEEQLNLLQVRYGGGDDRPKFSKAE